MDTLAARAPAPWHLWAIGLVSLLWNGFGAYDYLMSQMQNEQYIASMTEPFGYSAQQAIAYFDSFPIWADAAWALGVWGSVLGSILLLIRSRYAMHSFIVSLFGLAVGTIYQLQNPMPGLTDSSVALGFSIAITIVIVLLILYSRRMTAVGVLR